MMKSKYDGFCKRCKKKIWKGDNIEKDEDLGAWVHVDCPTGKKQTLGEAIAGRNASVNVISDEAVTAGDFDTTWTPSPFQQDIFDFIEKGEGNGVIEAVAGSGKTSTIVRGLQLVPKGKRVAFLAFNKHIAKELKRRAPEGVHVSTMHSLGYNLVRKLQDFKEIDEDKLGGIMDDFWPISKDKCEDQFKRSLHRKYRDGARKIVALLKATLVNYSDLDAVYEMMERYNIDVDENTPEILSKLLLIMDRCAKEVETIDYDDMIWLPLVHKRLKLNFEKFDYLFIDEAQDLNNAQMKFVMNSVYPESRVIAVGDRRQSLYGFRGADTEAIPRLIETLNAKVLPLSISYRCPKIHIQRAKQIVPQIEAAETAVEGSFDYMPYKKFLQEILPGDMVICRTNAPLVKPAFEVIKAGKKAIIRGKDIGKSLVTFVERFQCDSISALEVSMAEWSAKEYDRLLSKGKELQAEMVLDKQDTIKSVSQECSTVADLLQKLEMLFSDSNVGVVFSSVHRAKGLEAERVFILRPGDMPHPKAKQGWEIEQENNCLYVALTRSKNELYYVEEE